MVMRADLSATQAGAQADLAHVNATLRLFDCSGEPSDFPPYLDLTRIFRRGGTTALCMAALKAEGPLDTRELALRVMRANLQLRLMRIF
jgi:hypothetical protein